MELKEDEFVCHNCNEVKTDRAGTSCGILGWWLICRECVELEMREWEVMTESKLLDKWMSGNRSEKFKAEIQRYLQNEGMQELLNNFRSYTPKYHQALMDMREFAEPIILDQLPKLSPSSE